MKQLLKNKKAAITMQAIGVIAISLLLIGAGIFGVVFFAGAYVSGGNDDNLDSHWNWSWLLPGAVDDDNGGVPHDQFAHDALNLRFTCYDDLNEQATLATGIEVTLKDHHGAFHTYFTDGSGQVTTTGNIYKSYTWVDAYVGEEDNTTWGEQHFRFEVPGYGDSADDKPNPMDISHRLLYKRFATAAQITAKLFNGATDITSGDYNITTSGAIAILTMSWTFGTAERWLGDGYDHIEDGGETEEFWLFVKISSSSNTAPGSVDVSLSGAREAMFGTSAKLIGKRLDAWYYDLNAENAPISGRGPTHTVDITIDFSDCGYTSNRTEFTLDIYLCIGTPWDYFVSTGQYENYTTGEIFVDTDIASFVLES